MGMSVVQLFTRERRSLERFEALNNDHLAASLDANANFSQFYPATQVLGTLAVALLLWYGGGQVVRKAVSLGVLVAGLQYADRFFEPWICARESTWHASTFTRPSLPTVVGRLTQTGPYSPPPPVDLPQVREK